MAKDTQVKKRKASMPEADAEKSKVKKVKNSDAITAADEAPAKKRKATEDAAPVKVKKSKTPKVAATKTADPEPAEDMEIELDVPAAKKVEVTKATPKSKSKDVVEAKPNSKATKPTKVTKVEVKVTEENDFATDSEDDAEDDEDEEDQTEALLKGFESEGDEEDALNKEGLPEGQSVPERKKLTKAEEKKLKKFAEAEASAKPGVVYIGRIPHGFFEREMRAYFTQFGKILNLRISRNKKTGASKHYGWIQFESTGVADIVARSMNNYLMFGHLLKVKLVPDEQVQENLFKGANKRFKKVPWNKIEGQRIAQGASEEVWDSRVEKEEKRREEKAKKLQAIGYEFEAPKVKSAKGVAKKSIAAIEPAENVEATPATEAAPTTKASSKSKKKTAKKPKAEKVVVEEKIETMTEVIKEIPAAVASEVEAKPEKVKKTKKQTMVITKEVIAPVEEETAVLASESEPKPKKTKKEKKLKAEESEAVVETEVVTTTKAKKGKKGKKEVAEA